MLAKSLQDWHPTPPPHLSGESWICHCILIFLAITKNAFCCSGRLVGVSVWEGCLSIVGCLPRGVSTQGVLVGVSTQGVSVRHPCEQNDRQV